MLKRFRLSKSNSKSEPERKTSDASSLGSSSDVPLYSSRGRGELLAPSSVGSARGRSPSPTPPVLGLHVVHDPGYASSDIIFVHGLGGHSHRTWTKNHDAARFWPGAWLPFEPDVSATRILTFGYNANWKGSTKSISTVTDFAKELLYEMRFARDTEGACLNVGARPIIFIVHSMGGLVVKKAYLLGLHDETYRDVVRSVSAVIFLSTPHRGTNLADTLNRIVSATMQASKSFISDLNKSSMALEELNEQFRHIAPSLSIWSFYETLATTIGPRKLMILEKDSSILGYPTEISCPLQADHNSICKFDSPSDSNYVIVRNAIKSLVVSVLGDDTVASAEPSNRSAIEAFLRRCVTSEDDYSSLRRQWIPETCGWFLDDSQVAYCLEDPPTSQILWYSAPPASGKSVLAAFLVDHLRASRRKCQYFFFKHSENSRKSVANALRALVLQLTADMPDFKRRLLASSLESLGLESNDPMVIWRNTFERILFNMEAFGPIYWIIDALDECDAPKPFLDCLASLTASRPPITVVVVSRSTDSLAIAFDRASKILPVLRVGTAGQAHSQRDIAVFVSREIEHLPGNPAFRQKLQKKILSRTEGNFLWAKLVMNEIMECHTEESIDEVLDETPDDMTELYQRMERNLLSSTKKANKPLIRALLEWTVCAQRALTVTELSRALRPDFSGFLDLRRTIATACGQFIQVDSGGRVSLLHHTTREYFKGSQTSEFHISSRDTHVKLFRKAILVFDDPTLRVQLVQHQHALQAGDPFIFYAAVGWPYHLGHCTSNSSELLDTIVRFLRSTSVLSWIQTLALLKRLDVLAKASKVLGLVAKSIRKRDASRNPMLHRITDLECVDNWAVDLLKLVGKFGRQLTTDPTVVYDVVPAMCPPATAIHQYCYDVRNSIVRLYQGAQAGWNDNLGRLSMAGDAQAWDLCCAARTVAVLASTNVVHIWDSTNFAEVGRLATYGLKTTKLWTLPAGTLLASAASPAYSKATAMAFSVDNSRLLCGSDDNAIRVIDCNNFGKGWDFLNPDLLKETSQADGPLNSPMCLAFSPDGEHRRPSTNWFAVDRFTWNPITGHIIGIYRDGVVFKWHPLSNETVESHRTADEVAAAPTGKMFATSSSDGAIRLWNLAYFTVVYQLSSEDLVTGLVFSPDSRRFYDLRGKSVNAWEPNCLARALQEGDEHLSDTNSEDQSVTATSKFSEARVSHAEMVTTVCLPPDDRYGPLSYCAGYEDGGVLLFRNRDAGGTEIARFYNFLDVSHIAWSLDGSCVACADLAGEVQVVRLDLHSGSVKPQALTSPQVNLEDSNIQGLLFSPDSSVLFLWTERQGLFCAVNTGESLGSIELSAERRYWVCHPKCPQYLLGFGHTDLLHYSWNTMSLEKSVTFASEEVRCGRGGDQSNTVGDGATSMSSSPESVLHAIQSASHLLLLSKVSDGNNGMVTRILVIDDIASLAGSQATASNGLTFKKRDDSDISIDTSAEYTSYTSSQIRRLRLLLGLATITSPLTATIYLPLLPLLRRQFDASAQAINLTLTLYIVFQALSPALFGPASDAHGRRPVFLFTLALYVFANLGLALNQDGYAALLTLRAVQSLGASAAYALAFGVVADVCPPAKRGAMLGPVGMALNLGACVGPVVGGAVAYTRGDHVWVFWALLIVGVVLLLGVGMLLPETARGLVGNGGDPARFSRWQLSWLQLLRHHVRKSKALKFPEKRACPQQPSVNKAGPEVKRTGPFRKTLENLLACFRIILHRDTILTLWLHGSFYTVDYSFVAAVPDIFKDAYEFNELQIGLAYLPRGVGIISGSFFTGRLMDRNYRATVREQGRVDTQTGQQADAVATGAREGFPIERARSRSSYWMLAVATGTMVAYGWVIERAVHPAVPLVLQFMQGFWGTFFYTTYSTLLVDVYPDKSSTAAAATSVTRCAMAATGVAVLQPLLDAAGRGWYFTVLGVWSGGLGVVAVMLLRRKGMQWRLIRKDNAYTE
ncbi:NACHT and WD domain-containingprotein [Purpureocillium lilacinum]|uniref:NACHT and WD domain-containingprotein n=1 Tax=Purpureocillium lilacinum TaxID=33203 RepID=A0A179HL23_PURLI|nr:NACHT and WD domain-containingprotein [Purpureocillium lilacinum]OAQ90083.1 NACHT and WD domain-containingprotein [Purpureocillium lilacinum]